MLISVAVVMQSGVSKNSSPSSFIVHIQRAVVLRPGVSTTRAVAKAAMNFKVLLCCDQKATAMAKCSCGATRGVKNKRSDYSCCANFKMLVVVTRGVKSKHSDCSCYANSKMLLMMSPQVFKGKPSCYANITRALCCDQGCQEQAQ